VRSIEVRLCGVRGAGRGQTLARQKSSQQRSKSAASAERSCWMAASVNLLTVAFQCSVRPARRRERDKGEACPHGREER